jgi:hypothetical protein
MNLRGGALAMAIALATGTLVAGCGSSSNQSGTGGTGGGTDGGTGGSTGGTAGGGTGGQNTDASTDRPPTPVCGPYADGGMPSDAGVDAATNASFFVTSDTNMTGDLGGLNGADMRCQNLAAAVGLGGKVWHAYLSVEHGPGGDAGTGPINAKDRIGTGPWYNVKGALIAQDLTSLHARTGDPALFITERGVMINGQWTGSPAPLEHDILTGTNADGTLAVGKTCSDWTSAVGPPDGGAPDGGSLFVARVGHADGFGPMCNTATTPNNLTSWNSAHDNAGCNDNRPRGGAGRIYCFAAN